MPLYLYKNATAFVAAVERHVAGALARGLYGWPVTDCVVTLTDCAYSGDLTRVEVRLLASRLHEMQLQLPDLTAGEGVLESWFDTFEPALGRPPVRRARY